MTTDTTIRVRVVGLLAERVEAVCEYLNMSPNNFAEYALEQEINRQELNRLKDEITIQEIGKHILGEGQSLSIDIDLGDEDAALTLFTCQMCLRDFHSQSSDVEGPTFCRDCLSMAKGGDFSKLEAGF